MIQAFADLSFIRAGFLNAQESKANPPPFLMNQVHSADVLILNKAPDKAPDCDALVTTKQGLQLTIKTADCAPVLFVDTKAKIIGAAHAGWKGAMQGVLENTILSMLSLGAHTGDIQAAVGPHLMQQSFQASPQMQALFPITEHIYFSQNESGLFFDFTGYIEHRLQRAGIQNITIARIDTFKDLTYNSYRREPNNPARQFSFITLI